MINLAKDPKGYYVALGIAEDASVDDIKSAFRTKAKRLHPDHNPSPIATKQFHRIHEAYETLSDPLRRAAYDRGWKTFTNTAQSKAETESEAKPKTESPPPPPREEPKARPKAEAVRPSASEQPVECQCGKITAQPRYIMFDMIWGRVTKLQRRTLAGVYCRSCADRAALKASLVTWLAGWWAWPDGPRESVKAILGNMRGGRKPPERNAKLLMRQARAFRARGDAQLARACAEQALAFASTAGLRREVDSLLLSMSAFQARGIKDRWARPGWAPLAQLAPIAIIIGAVSLSVTMSTPQPLTEYARELLAPAPVVAPAPAVAPPPSDIRVGRVHAVGVEQTQLRTGPADTFRVLALLTKGNVLLVTETDPAGLWVRVTLSDGVEGFVEAKDLTPDVGVDALGALGGFAPSKAPQ
ncbi:MAG: DnaJ domain-containing protein [Rhodospirillaceae bacterium]|nr:DnaJ domain-containing protein [Rhodospirillaceae bacterium]